MWLFLCLKLLGVEVIFFNLILIFLIYELKCVIDNVKCMLNTLIRKQSFKNLDKGVIQ